MSSHGSISQPGPGAPDERARLIAKWHAQGHDQLDYYDLPRFADGIEYTIAERIAMLAERGDVEPVPRPGPDIHVAPLSFTWLGVRPGGARAGRVDDALPGVRGGGVDVTPKQVRGGRDGW